jgi:hypothetical protein
MSSPMSFIKNTFIYGSLISLNISCVPGPDFFRISPENGESSVMGKSIDEDFLPLKITLDEKSSQLLKTWTPNQRQFLTMLLEHQGRRDASQIAFAPLTVPQLVVDPRLVHLEMFSFQQPAKDIQLKNQQRLSQWLGNVNNLNLQPIRIPIHPTATRLHPALEALKENCTSIEKNENGTVYPTMSRSLWVQSPDGGLYTIKMGTNVVGSRVEENKLDGQDDSLDTEVRQINHLSTNSQILPMLEKRGILTLPDQTGVLLSPIKSKVSQSYGISIRSYDQVLFPPSGKPVILMPRKTLNKSFFAQSTHGEKFAYVPIGSKSVLEISRDQAKLMVEELHRQVGVFMAVFHANGFRYEYLHDQNAMVAIEPSPFKVSLVVRDLGDVEDLVEKKGLPESQWNIKPPRENEVGLNGIMFAFGFNKDKESSDHLKKILYESYTKTLQEIGFSLPAGYSYKSYKTPNFITSIIANSKFFSHFIPQIESVRKNGRVQ